MGNSSPGKFSSADLNNKASLHSNNSVSEKSKALAIDPRSPSEGIVRTPIQFGNGESFQFDDSKLKTNGDTQSPTMRYADVFLTDWSNFETLDGVLTEDDSIHRAEIVEDGIAALSDTEVTTKPKSRKDIPSLDSVPRTRLSWVERLSGRRSGYESPSLFVRLRHKRNYEKRKNDRKFQQHGDSSDSPQVDHFSKPEAFMD
ncbi:hypothetical protein CRM22_003692 [Opisthorchis felineus]|uniref:Uncharacterized protein n=1 Tax=Opisthorchis felineus TaxID=147828 RepID=A0A4S2M023_OPIFE|nr:hypothetical protein CRM22_003692 [Opisthorchis felineus]TGZ69541.1 hypothetical protein CRM22_003692 [Opisthorchis felineus]TGZ69542.1 hypothetical protein CRM22_003692 [Opisthorchis felineus]TGZ69543.1 hypothetical protein CRM22_003692 [Opisthorchis felineus]